MANYHLVAKTISRARGQSAIAAAAYRAGEKLEDERTGEISDYTRKNDIDYSQIMLPTNAPSQLANRATLWNTVEAKENRKDSQVAREVELSLPTELTPEQNIELLCEFIQGEFIALGMIADANCHKLKSHNPHAHVMLTMREFTQNGFGPKNRTWNDKKLIEHWRQKWAEFTNVHLKKTAMV